MKVWYQVQIPEEVDYRDKNFAFSVKNGIVSNFPYHHYNGYNLKSPTFRNHLLFHKAKVVKIAEQLEPEDIKTTNNAYKRLS